MNDCIEAEVNTDKKHQAPPRFANSNPRRCPCLSRGGFRRGQIFSDYFEAPFAFWRFRSFFCSFAPVFRLRSAHCSRLAEQDTDHIAFARAHRLQLPAARRSRVRFCECSCGNGIAVLFLQYPEKLREAPLPPRKCRIRACPECPQEKRRPPR